MSYGRRLPLSFPSLFCFLAKQLLTSAIYDDALKAHFFRGLASSSATGVCTKKPSLCSLFKKETEAISPFLRREQKDGCTPVAIGTVGSEKFSLFRIPF